jgi:3-methylfumaryl-CoA hydratase
MFLVSDAASTDYGHWIGRRESVSDVISPAPAARLSALLDHSQAAAKVGDALPPCWHWLYFLDAVPSFEVGEDGHRQRGGFLPPVSLPRRMWAGSNIRFHSPIRLGDEVLRESTISAVNFKQGRSGELVFVQVDHQFFREEELLLEERQDIVYREAVTSGVTESPEKIDNNRKAEAAAWSQQITPDQTLLFRFSALTFNGHRIHYDRDYAVGVEGYPGLVVQGPLTAILLLDLLRREKPNAELDTFEFRGQGPLFEGRAIDLLGDIDGDNIALRAMDEAGELAMSARAHLENA